ncbi:MAG TPA: hypothetical protein VLZ12_04015 [Verrucomicrobiae bacterium]|nr:hypothetical protein [Verrucomicrobiae bacterium]
MASSFSDHIIIEGARQNNLKGINLKLPLGELIVVTGPGNFTVCVVSTLNSVVCTLPSSLATHDRL